MTDSGKDCWRELAVGCMALYRWMLGARQRMRRQRCSFFILSDTAVLQPPEGLVVNHKLNYIKREKMSFKEALVP